MIRNYIRRWLGIDEIEYRLASKIRALQLSDAEMETIIHRLRARVMPETLSESDPLRIGESDRIGAEAIRRLQAEAKAREPYNK